ncbi:meiotic recombination protein REC114 [Pempheris klunzingeri]|uniref:meiotic recombination protein REC114 n=1 Tax=Pempheris klunzingeri TaxID=3127111 RepID=UPI003980AA57
MATSRAWRLKRYGRFVPGSAGTGGKPWKVFEANGDKPEIILTVVESGYLLVIQGQESLDTIPLLGGPESLRVHQRADNLLLRFTVKGESRMMRMQFDGSTRMEVVEECSSAVDKLREYVSVSTQDDALPPPNQPPTVPSAPLTQRGVGTLSLTGREQARGGEQGRGPPSTQQGRGTLSIQGLTERLLGGAAVPPPQVHSLGCLEEVAMAVVLRVCLLDPSFFVFVERTEEELRKLLQE